MKREMPLWTVSIPVSAKIEEATVELLEHIFSVSPSVYVDAETRRTTASVYLPTKPPAFHLRHLQEELGRFGQVGVPAVKRLPSQDWAESWKRHFKPIDIRGRMLIRPSWSRRRPRKGQAEVVLDPGLSFGTGQHATTRFCLEQIVALRRPEMRQSFLDIGTGSGILAIAAAKMGYAPVCGFDIDRDAVRIARGNIRKNQVGRRVSLECHDVAALAKATKGYDLVCANLIYDVLLAYKSRIISQLKPTGRLVLAGILKSQFKSVAEEYRRSGWELIGRKSEGEWESGIFSAKK